MNIIDLTDKTFVVTGAGSGIGRETSKLLSEQGSRVVLLDLNPEGLDETKAILTGKGHILRALDITDFESLPMLVKEIIAETGAVDGLVHCAGISSRKPLNVLRPDGFSKVMDVNFYSFEELTRLLTKKGNMNDGGSIVVMSSISSIRGYKAKTEYCVSKAAVDAFGTVAGALTGPVTSTLIGNITDAYDPYQEANQYRMTPEQEAMSRAAQSAFANNGFWGM